MGKALISFLLEKVDPKWIPAVITGIGVFGSVVYLIYTRSKLQSEKEALQVKLAKAKSDALNPGIMASQEKQVKLAKEAAKVAKQIEQSKQKISNLRASSAVAAQKLKSATSWEDLGL